MGGFEPPTSSLPRTRSTPELHRLLHPQHWGNFNLMSGRRDSNSRPSAWKADALPTELLPLKFFVVGGEGFEPSKVKPTDLQSVLVGRLSIPPTLYNTIKERAGGGIRTPDMLITNQLLWPTELHRLLLYFPLTTGLTAYLQCKTPLKKDCKCTILSTIQQYG
jgi:hypothetical protein